MDNRGSSSYFWTPPTFGGGNANRTAPNRTLPYRTTQGKCALTQRHQQPQCNTEALMQHGNTEALMLNGNTETLEAVM